MLQSRRGFLIGAGSLLTTAFVSEATAFVRTTGKPLLLLLPTKILAVLGRLLSCVRARASFWIQTAAATQLAGISRRSEHS